MGELWFRCSKGTWIGEKASASGSCPFCANPALAIDIAQHWADVGGVERGEYSWPSYKKKPAPADWKPRPHPGFGEMWVWALAQNRCFNHMVHLKHSYKKNTGIEVDIEP